MTPLWQFIAFACVVSVLAAVCVEVAERRILRREAKEIDRGILQRQLDEARRNDDAR